MASKSIIIAAVAVVVVVAAVVYVVYPDDEPSYADSDGLKAQPAVNDSYTLTEAADTLGSVGDSTTYTVTAVDGQNLEVEVSRTSDGVTDTSHQRMTVDEYYTNIYYYVEEDDRGRVETISTPWGDKQVYVVTDDADSGANDFRTVDYVGVGSYIVYRSEITITSISGTETIVRELTSADVVVDSSEATVEPPSEPAPAPSDEAVATTVQVGDYIEWYVEEDDGDTKTVTYTVTRVDGNRVTYSEAESDDDDDDDYETTNVTRFLGMITYTPGWGVTEEGRETITVGDYGSVECIKYVRGDDDRDEWTELYVGVDNGVLYRTVEYDDNRPEETQTLVRTSLIGGSGSGGSSTVTPETGGNSYGIELAVGDWYEIRETDDDGDVEVTRYTIVNISGNRLTVEESEDNGRDIDYESESANSFLGRIMASPSMIAGLGAPVTTGTQGSYSYTEYQVTERDGDTTTYWIEDSNYLILKITEYDADDRDTEEDALAGIGIAGLS